MLRFPDLFLAREIVCLLFVLFVCSLFFFPFDYKNRSIQPGGKIAHDDLLAFFKASRMVLDFDEIELKSVIGSGAFATVFRGIYRHRIGRPGETGGDRKIVRSLGLKRLSFFAMCVCVCASLCVCRARLSFSKDGETTRLS